MDSSNIWFAFALSSLAGLSTGIGSAIGMLGKRTNKRLLTLAMGFSAGVMVYVSFAELLPAANEALDGALGARSGSWAGLAAFFGGMLVIGLIDRFVPSPENPHEFPSDGDAQDEHADQDPPSGGPSAAGRGASAASGRCTNGASAGLWRVGLMTTFALALHNFPEGMATLFGGLKAPEVGIPIAVAVALHNIPEGIAVAVPIHHATGSRSKAFFYSFFSGLAEPVGAILGYALLWPFLNDAVFGILFAAVAGIMVFISFDQLLPAAERYGEHHASIYGVVGGMLVMAVSLVLL